MKCFLAFWLRVSVVSLSYLPNNWAMEEENVGNADGTVDFMQIDVKLTGTDLFLSSE